MGQFPAEQCISCPRSTMCAPCGTAPPPSRPARGCSARCSPRACRARPEPRAAGRAGGRGVPLLTIAAHRRVLLHRARAKAGAVSRGTGGSSNSHALPQRWAAACSGRHSLSFMAGNLFTSPVSHLFPSETMSSRLSVTAMPYC